MVLTLTSIVRGSLRKLNQTHSYSWPSANQLNNISWCKLTYGSGAATFLNVNMSSSVGMSSGSITSAPSCRESVGLIETPISSIVFLSSWANSEVGRPRGLTGADWKSRVAFAVVDILTDGVWNYRHYSSPLTFILISE